MIDDGWTVIVICPHGVKHRGPLSVLRGFQPLVDSCPAALKEKALAEALKAQRKKLSWKQKRRLRKSLKGLTESLNALSAGHLPPSWTKEPPTQE